MGSITDEVTSSTIASLILGLPILVGISILFVPFIIIAGFIGVPIDIMIKSVLAFGAAVFLVWIFSRHQIIENGIVGLILGRLVYTHFKWHPVFCILIGLGVIGFLFFFSSLKIGFWIKTGIFSLIVTVLVYGAFYSDSGIYPASDNIWRVTFFIVFLLENIYIRFCSYSENSF